jgi:hypothetical protein
MIIVALTSFSIGVVLRFGLATNPMIQEGDFFWPLAQYLAANTKNVEVVVGVLLPILMLIGFEKTKRSNDPRAIAIAGRTSHESAQDPSEESRPRFDPFPARMVSISLLVIGIWMAILGFRENTGRIILFSFACALVITGLVIHMLIRKLLGRDSTTI